MAYLLPANIDFFGIPLGLCEADGKGNKSSLCFRVDDSLSQHDL